MENTTDIVTKNEGCDVGLSPSPISPQLKQDFMRNLIQEKKYYEEGLAKVNNKIVILHGNPYLQKMINELLY